MDCLDRLPLRQNNEQNLTGLELFDGALVFVVAIQQIPADDSRNALAL